MEGTKIEDGGPAFPDHPNGPGHSGMSLRGWFAGQAMAGMLASFADNGEPGFPADGKMAQWAYEYADAMIVRRTVTSPR